MKEIWKRIEIEEGLDMYEVSNLGRVRLERPTGKQRKRILSQSNSSGYLIVMLNPPNKKRRPYYVHRLIAHAFCKGYSEGLVVNHIDENKQNNLPSNLEWVSQKENLNHNDCVYKATRKLINGARSSSVIGTNVKTGEVVEFPSTMEAQRAGFTSTHVAACARGTRKTHKGYTWKYKGE